MTILTSKDYMNILTYYKINTNTKTKKQQRSIAEKLLAKKLCRCIQKVKMEKRTPNNINKKTKRRNREIRICRNAVIKRKGYRIKQFSCKKKPIIKGLNKL